FETRVLGALQVTALPLQHSRPTLGYLLEGGGRRIAYLTDTVGLPEATYDYLQRQPLHALILDCSMPPQPQTPRNHNDLTLALDIIERLKPVKAVLTHIGHTLDAWLMEQPRPLPDNVLIARDGMVV
ncbi:MBL fold metallo-hydrolase, partial [Pseudomonas viridiflava]